MPKNIISITVTITLEDIEKIKSSKQDNKIVETNQGAFIC